MNSSSNALAQLESSSRRRRRRRRRHAPSLRYHNEQFVREQTTTSELNRECPASTKACDGTESAPSPKSVLLFVPPSLPSLPVVETGLRHRDVADSIWNLSLACNSQVKHACGCDARLTNLFHSEDNLQYIQ